MPARLHQHLPTLYWLLPLIAIVLLAQMLAPAALGWLRYEPGLWGQAEPWRLLTGHLIHLGWAHAWVNLAALVVLVCAFPLQARARLVPLAMLFIALAMSMCFLLFTRVEWYVGLSGVLHGVVVVLAASLWRSQHWLSVLFLLGLVVKLIWELHHGVSASLEARVGGPVLVQAHLYGAVAGLPAGLYAWIIVRRG